MHLDKLLSLYRKTFSSVPSTAEPLPGSGSNRLYWRLGAGNPVVGTYGPVAEENRAFVGIGTHLRSQGVRVPKVLAVSEDGLYYLQEDLGSQSLFSLLENDRAEGKYSHLSESLLLNTVAKLPEIQFEGARGLDFGLCYPVKEFGERLVNFDLNYFKYAFLKPSGLSFNEYSLQDDLDLLRRDLLPEGGSGGSVSSTRGSSPLENCFMYRDFQCRNVIIREGEPWFIDFQGGMKGPAYYDLASFVWQARANYPPALRTRMVSAYLCALRQYVPNVDEETFRSRLRLFVLFRSLQVLGAYGFRGLYEGKAHFVKSIPFALANISSLLPFSRYPCLSECLERLSSLPRFSFEPPSEKASIQTGTTLLRDLAASELDSQRLCVDVCSFSYKSGIPPGDNVHGGGFVFDLRAVENPGRLPQYRHLTGMDADVKEFLENDGAILRYLQNVYALVDSHVEAFLSRGFTHMSVCFGCTGGRHRSVYSAQALAEHLAGKYDVDVRLRHRALGVDMGLLKHTREIKNSLQ